LAPLTNCYFNSITRKKRQKHTKTRWVGWENCRHCYNNRERKFIDYMYSKIPLQFIWWDLSYYSEIHSFILLKRMSACRFNLHICYWKYQNWPKQFWFFILYRHVLSQYDMSKTHMKHVILFAFALFMKCVILKNKMNSYTTITSVVNTAVLNLLFIAKALFLSYKGLHYNLHSAGIRRCRR
jgi:hypothetical protein